MDWDKVKKAVGTVAPWLAATLGTPVAGVAVKALCDVLGVSGDSGTPDTVTAALAGATPQQLQDLHIADQRHAEFMQQIGYANLQALEAIAAQDWDSARKREEVVRDNTPKVLAALSVLLFIALLWFVSTGQVVEGMRDGFWMLSGAAISIVKDVYGYYFGSSAGSHAKDDTIAVQAGAK